MLIEHLLAARPQWGWVLENTEFRDNIIAILKLFTHSFVMEKAQVQMTDGCSRLDSGLGERKACVLLEHARSLCWVTVPRVSGPQMTGLGFESKTVPAFML